MQLIYNYALFKHSFFSTVHVRFISFYTLNLLIQREFGVLQLHLSSITSRNTTLVSRYCVLLFTAVVCPVLYSIFYLKLCDFINRSTFFIYIYMITKFQIERWEQNPRVKVYRPLDDASGHPQ